MFCGSQGQGQSHFFTKKVKRVNFNFFYYIPSADRRNVKVRNSYLYIVTAHCKIEEIFWNIRNIVLFILDTIYLWWPKENLAFKVGNFAHLNVNEVVAFRAAYQPGVN